MCSLGCAVALVIEACRFCSKPVFNLVRTALHSTIHRSPVELGAVHSPGFTMRQKRGYCITTTGEARGHRGHVLPLFSLSGPCSPSLWASRNGCSMESTPISQYKGKVPVLQVLLQPTRRNGSYDGRLSYFASNCNSPMTQFSDEAGKCFVGLVCTCSPRNSRKGGAVWTHRHHGPEDLWIQRF